MKRFKIGQKDAGQIAHLGCMAEIGLHEHFYAAPPARVFVSHGVGHHDLHIKGQLFGRAFGDQVKVRPYRPKEVFGGDKAFIFLGCEDALFNKVICVLNAVNEFRDPEQGL